MAEPQDKNLEAMSPGPTEEEWQAAEKVITSLQVVRKNYSLYPEKHVNCERALEKFWLQLDKYLRAHGNLRFELEKDQLIFQGEAILSEPPEEGNLPFTLFRDGIQWLEFQGGIDATQVEQFLRILNKYNVLTDEPEGDLVTALWEARFPHIRYHVADYFWGGEPDVELTASPEMLDEDSDLSEEEDKKATESECFPPIDQATLKITSEEEVKLQEIVRLEEKRDPTIGFLAALLDSLLENREQENFKVVLEAMEDEFHDSLVRKDLDISLKILKSLHYVRKICAAETTWAIPIIDNFFLTASSSKSLQPLQAAWTDIDAEQIEQTKQILLLLHPEAIRTLAAMLLQTSALRLQKMLMDVMISLASRDLSPLESLLNRQDEELLQKLVHVLGRLDGERPFQILKKMIHHSSVRVRQEALRVLLSRDPGSIKELFALIEDENEFIRRLILKHMGQSKDKVTEGLLLDYLEQQKLKLSEYEHIIACFRALGQCGSPRSIPFLSRTLLSRAWMPSFWRSAYRLGAAVALKAMGLEGARQVLEDASKSKYPTVRSIVRKVMQDQPSAEEA